MIIVDHEVLTARYNIP